jgi:hypothetical protein
MQTQLDKMEERKIPKALYTINRTDSLGILRVCAVGRHHSAAKGRWRERGII